MGRLKRIFVIIVGLVAFGLLVYQLPPIKSRLDWRIANWVAKIRYGDPDAPAEAVFLPQSGPATQQADIDFMVTETLRALLPSLAPTPTPTETPVPTVEGPTATLIPSHTPTLTPTPIPDAVILSGIRHEYEQWNNCGPATLGMQLSYWGWAGNQSTTAAFLKPNPRDKNVSPHELVAYVETQTDLRALVRMGGTLDLLKEIVAAGFPVMVEKTLDLVNVDGWIGHYVLVSGYDDAGARFSTQDSYIQADYPEPYDKIYDAWRSFNFTFFVIYPPEREAELFSVLGEYAGSTRHLEIALARAEEEIVSLEGLPRYFAWFNKGTSLAKLGETEAAAEAFDTAFAVYAELPLEVRPWRMVWYQHDIYEAYFALGRYQDIVDLANWVFLNAGEPALEESFYWRALAKEQLGNRSGAIDDLEQAVQWNPDFQDAQDALVRLRDNG